LVTGAGGQLGKELQVLAGDFAGYRFLFADKAALNIGDAAATAEYFAAHAINFCINCAAYTAVDKAETEQDAAYLINAGAVANLAQQCGKYNALLIHISTDYVFDGTASQPYKETDKTNPVSIYGKSKLLGEELARHHCQTSIIIRTAWLYSAFNANFVKTMLRLMKEKESINVVNDQYGCPTYAADLAAAVLQIIASGKSNQYPGIYHYSNSGITNWYEFAVAIKKITGSNCMVNPITTAKYLTPAKRPAYSVLDTTKITETFGLNISHWENSLKKCLALLK
jgi:dTDP-4-dehydrorhamnose reductase